MNGFSKISPMDFPVLCTTDYRFSFNGKENDNEVKGIGNQQDYGFRIYNPRLGKFLSVDPLTKDYPYLTPYQFASNSPISGVDLDGLEYYYAADGKFLGQGKDNSSLEVRRADDFKPLEGGGSVINNYTSVHGNHNDFKAMAGVLYAEADGTTSEAADEVAGIYSVLENRASLEGTTVQEQMTTAKGVYGASEADKINQADKTGMTAKKEAVFSGVIKGILSETDFSNGAFYWDGKDFEKGGGHNERYKPGFQFTDKSHDLFNQGDNKKSGTANGVTWDYKYQSTGAKGKTTFSKLTDKWRDAQYPGAGKGKQVGKGKE